jgi:hypothetical protein
MTNLILAVGGNEAKPTIKKERTNKMKERNIQKQQTENKNKLF